MTSNHQVVSQGGGVAEILSAEAVRVRCNQIFSLAKDDRLRHFRYQPERLGAVVGYVGQVIRKLYPTGQIPFHSRLRHFDVGGVARCQGLQDQLKSCHPDERIKTWFDLVIVSVLMDGGAGPSWSYEDHRYGGTYQRSEGLAVASYNLFQEGWFSLDPKKDPLRVDGARLAQITESELATALQVSNEHPLVGLSGRWHLLRNLGQLVLSQPDVFPDILGSPQPRLGQIAEHVTQGLSSVSAGTLLRQLLFALGPIWPGRLTLNGTPLGDVWHHPQVGGLGDTSGMIPFHKLSQWLTYSLLEVLATAGIKITDLDQLTGLAEYRNGGLILDLGLITLKDPAQAKLIHRVDSPLIVEWRALTVALLDLIADGVRRDFGASRSELPLVKVLEGGTWHAGRKIAATLRPDRSAPLMLASDGTVF